MTYIVEMPIEVARHLEDALHAPDGHGTVRCGLCRQCVEWIVRETKSPTTSSTQQGHYTPPPAYAPERPFGDPAPLDDPSADWEPLGPRS